jgi:ACS family hexuronate transporter-like MFS transporter
VACVAFISLATACHQAWSANLFTNATISFPKGCRLRRGLGATAGGIGGMFMTLLVGLAVEWTHRQQVAFLLAGVLHVMSLAIFWFWFKGKFEQVKVDSSFDTSRLHRGLIAAGLAILALAAWLLTLVTHRWEFIVNIVKFSGALQAALAAVGFGLIGVALLYASMPRRPRLPG